MVEKRVFSSFLIKSQNINEVLVSYNALHEIVNEDVTSHIHLLITD